MEQLEEEDSLRKTSVGRAIEVLVSAVQNPDNRCINIGVTIDIERYIYIR